MPYFPNRTLESIKGQRKYQRHKDKVLQILREMEEENEPISSPAQGEDRPSASPEQDLISAIQELFEQLEPLSGTEYNVERLDRICKGLSTWSIAKIYEELELYLLKIFPPARKRKGKASSAPKRDITKRQARRVEYAKTQKAWKKNPCNCLRVILKGKTLANPPTKQCMVNFWRTTMTNGTNESPDCEAKQPEITGLWRPVVPSEILKSYPEMTTCPGPDGLTVRQLRAVPINILTRIFNLFLFCGKLPKHLLVARTTLIPKKDGAEKPEDYRPITVQSVVTRTFHKILARRLTNMVTLDKRQKAFLPTDGCAEHTFDLDLVLRYHRQNFKPLYMASMDIAKAFDSVSHKTIRDTLSIIGSPSPMTDYIMDTYNRCHTTLTFDNWESEAIKPTCGVKQGDPLSPIIFNMIMNRLLKRLPPEVGVDIGNVRFNALMFADDIIFLATTPNGLQLTVDIASEFLAQCGLFINASKSFTVALRNVPHVKKSVVDGKTQFKCRGHKLPSLRREDEWKYLGVPFTPEGRSMTQPEVKLKEAIDKLTRAPLKPQQRLFALRIIVLPGLYHLLTLDVEKLSGSPLEGRNLRHPKPPESSGAISSGAIVGEEVQST
ncbi:unnamed protein product [Xylocopa violacea]|uniref:Reverse transcriptase domain-containing protein n=1 Tax=Xylocopa violacea TaxID=135666 RepID=A0ABP1MXU7_XYLVO